jgi:hypothetical protein
LRLYCKQVPAALLLLLLSLRHRPLKVSALQLHTSPVCKQRQPPQHLWYPGTIQRVHILWPRPADDFASTHIKSYPSADHSWHPHTCRPRLRVSVCHQQRAAMATVSSSGHTYQRPLCQQRLLSSLWMPQVGASGNVVHSDKVCKAGFCGHTYYMIVHHSTVPFPGRPPHGTRRFDSRGSGGHKPVQQCSGSAISQPASHSAGAHGRNETTAASICANVRPLSGLRRHCSRHQPRC